MLNELGQRFHEDAKAKGFWDKERNPAEVLMLIVSKAAEALEEIRAGHGLNEAMTTWHSTPYSHHLRGEVTMTSQGSFFHYGTPHQRQVTDEDYKNAGFLAKPEGVPSEMADIIIRTLEACAAWGIDIEEALWLKVEYNRQRGHMNGGKKF